MDLVVRLRLRTTAPCNGPMQPLSRFSLVGCAAWGDGFVPQFTGLGGSPTCLSSLCPTRKPHWLLSHSLRHGVCLRREPQSYHVTDLTVAAQPCHDDFSFAVCWAASRLSAVGVHARHRLAQSSMYVLLSFLACICTFIVAKHNA